MTRIPDDVPVVIFDPALPFEKVLVSNTGVDTWHDHILITKKTRDQLPYVKEDSGTGVLKVSGGVSMQVPAVTIGLKIGAIEIPELSALVVDHGVHEVLIGSSIFGEIFKASFHGEDSTQEQKRSAETSGSDPDELRIELFPTEYPFNSKHLEDFLARQRQLYNTSLIAIKQINPSGLSQAAIDAIVDLDEGIPEHLRLKVASVEQGSIKIALRSGCKTALRYLSSVFEKGASAKLAQELAEAKDAEIKASISQEIRDATALEARLEKEKLSSQHIHETYQQHRAEARERISFLDELLEKLDDSTMREQLRAKKNEAILEMAEQMMVPVVRQVPGARSTLRSTRLALPPPSNSTGEGTR